MAEIPLGGGRVTEVVRVGDSVRRAVGPWTPGVHAYLRHLRLRGFSGAPAVLGLDEKGREILEYVPGRVPSRSSWVRGEPTPLPEGAHSEEALVRAAALLRELHEAGRDFVPPEGAVWRESDRPAAPGEIICHRDAGPHNTVYRDGLPVAFIDWDSAGPDRPELEAARGAWWFVPLASPEYCLGMGFPAPPDLRRRLRLFSEAYGADLLPHLQDAKERDVERLRFWPTTAAEAAGFLRAVARELDWLAANLASLRLEPSPLRTRPGSGTGHV